MREQRPSHETSRTAHVVLNGPGWKMSVQVGVPTGPSRWRQVLPLAQALGDCAVSATTQALAKEGRSVSCTKGCSACCRQLVTISEVEAANLRDLVDALPEPQQVEIRGRFDEAR